MFDFKRLIGRKFSDSIVQDHIKLWPFKVESGDNDKPLIVVQYKGNVQEKFTAEQITSILLTKLKN